MNNIEISATTDQIPENKSQFIIDMSASVEAVCNSHKVKCILAITS